MSSICYEISQEPVGYIVYALFEGNRLSLGAFCNACNLEILEVTKIMAQEGGFQAEPKDALAFFLFEDRANSFVKSVEKLG